MGTGRYRPRRTPLESTPVYHSRGAPRKDFAKQRSNQGNRSSIEAFSALVKRAWRASQKVLKIAPLEPKTQRSERRLPLELTGTVTAIMALVSFAFVAAIILGMI
jgi:hypothetical protein